MLTVTVRPHSDGELKRRGPSWCTPDRDRHLCAPVAEGPYGPRPLCGLRVSPVLLNSHPFLPRAPSLCCSALPANALQDGVPCLSPPLRLFPPRRPSLPQPARPP